MEGEGKRPKKEGEFSRSFLVRVVPSLLSCFFLVVSPCPTFFLAHSFAAIAVFAALFLPLICYCPGTGSSHASPSSAAESEEGAIDSTSSTQKQLNGPTSRELQQFTARRWDTQTAGTNSLFPGRQQWLQTLTRSSSGFDRLKLPSIPINSEGEGGVNKYCPYRPYCPFVTS